MLALVDLLLVGVDPNEELPFGWMDAWELNPDLDSLWRGGGNHFG
jgi:hypothetical protein